VGAGIRQLAASGKKIKALQNHMTETERLGRGSCANNLSNRVSETAQMGKHEPLPGFFDFYRISKQRARTHKHPRSISVQVCPLALGKAVEIVTVSRGGDEYGLSKNLVKPITPQIPW
jgi:hypothetical protein